MADFSDREHRQFARMRRRIGDLRDGDAIGPIISDFKALVWQLEERQEAFRDKYLEAWGVLEVAYAMELEARERGRPGKMPTADDPDVVEALARIDGLLDPIGE